VLDFEGKMLVQALKQTREAIECTDDKIEDICLQFLEYSYLRTIPGFGPGVSSIVRGPSEIPFVLRIENRS